MSTKRILILFAHPAYQRSRANRVLLEAARTLDAVSVQDLYEAYPDFAVDVPHEKQLLVTHDVVVFQHPLYWYSCPALLKEWMDLVLEYGFAYGHDGTALRGKWLLSAVTSGASRAAYRPDGANRHALIDFLAPFAQTAALCGMEYLPPFVVDGMRQHPDGAAIGAFARQYRLGLEGLASGHLGPAHWAGRECLNDAVDDASREGTHG